MKKILCMCLLLSTQLFAQDSTQLFAQDYVNLVKDYHQDKLTVQETLKISDIKNKHWKPVYSGVILKQERDVESKPLPIWLNSIVILNENSNASGGYLAYTLTDPIYTIEDQELLKDYFPDISKIKTARIAQEELRGSLRPIESQNLLFTEPNTVQFKLMTSISNGSPTYDNLTCVKIIEHEDFPEVLICKVLEDDVSEIFTNYWVLTGR